MIFRPQSTSLTDASKSLITLGSDFCFKKWSLVDDTDIYSKLELHINFKDDDYLDLFCYDN